MEKVGLILQELRVAQGLTVADIEAKTKIRGKYIKALEEGNLGVLPGEVYVLGFVRSYLKTLGVTDDSQIIAEYKNYFQEQKTQDDLKVESDFTNLDMKEATRTKSVAVAKKSINTREKSFAGKYIILSLLLIVVAGLAGLYYVGTLETPATPSEVQPDIVQPDVAEPEPEEEEPVEPVFEGVRVLVTATNGACWVGVTIDGVYSEETLIIGDMREYIGDELITIKFGNAGGVKVEWNDEILDPVGSSGAVLTVDFTPAVTDDESTEEQ